MALSDRLQHAWNAFMNKDPTPRGYGYYGTSRPDRRRLSRGNERSIVTAVLNRIAVDASMVKMEHVKQDENGNYLETIDDGLNRCLTRSANKDQTGRAFIQDTVLSMLDEGVVALVPVDTDINPSDTAAFDIKSVRVAKILSWYPDYVKVELYDDRTGRKREITLPKKLVCIIENPFYATMNEPSSTLQRIIRKLTLLDIVDEHASSGKLDLIIQLPYITKNLSRQEQAERRRAALEDQLTNSRYGVGYIDGTEKITQLNRPLENNLLSQIEYLMSMLYSQLGISQKVMDGTADEKEMLNYQSRTVGVVLTAITDEMKRKWLSNTAITQGHSIDFFENPFKLVPVSALAELADKFGRNEILSSNEFRAILGYKPSKDPRANELVNKNLPQENEGEPSNGSEEYQDEEDSVSFGNIPISQIQ